MSDLEPNLAKEIPQAHRRAHAYELKDDGGIKWSRDRRARKNNRRNLKLAIAEMERRLAGPEQKTVNGRTIAYDKDEIRVRLERLHAALRELDETSDLGTPRVIAPMTRRVAREDRRRSKK